MMNRSMVTLFLTCSALVTCVNDAKAGKLTIEVQNSKGTAAACRVHLVDEAGTAVEPPGLPFWKDHFVCPGRVELASVAGTYRYVIERGPEHEQVSGKVKVTEGG